MTQARQTILENFDEDVAAKLKDCQTSTVASMDKYTRWLYYFFLMHGAKRVEPLDQLRFRVDKMGILKHTILIGNQQKHLEIYFLEKMINYIRLG